jgi:predicted Zn-dependent protease
MAVPKFKAEWFEALNDIKPNDKLTPGQKVKVIK